MEAWVVSVLNTIASPEDSLSDVVKMPNVTRELGHLTSFTYLNIEAYCVYLRDGFLDLIRFHFPIKIKQEGNNVLSFYFLLGL